MKQLYQTGEKTKKWGEIKFCKISQGFDCGITMSSNKIGSKNEGGVFSGSIQVKGVAFSKNVNFPQMLLSFGACCLQRVGAFVVVFLKFLDNTAR